MQGRAMLSRSGPARQLGAESDRLANKHQGSLSGVYIHTGLNAH